MYRPLTNGSSARGPRIALGSMTMLVFVCSTTAEARTMRIEPVDNSSALSGFVTQDFWVATQLDWTGSAIRVDLTDGIVYQNPLNNTVTQPMDFVLDFDPAAEFDTFVGFRQSQPIHVAGGAGDLGKFGFQFDETGLGLTWGNVLFTDVGTFPTARVTLSDDAQGAWAFLLTAGGTGEITVFEGRIVDGAMVPAIDVDLRFVRIEIPTPFSFDGTLLSSVDVQGLSDAELMSLRVTTSAGEVVAASSLGLTPGELRFALGSAGVIPEPATLALLAAGLAASTRRRPATPR